MVDKTGNPADRQLEASRGIARSLAAGLVAALGGAVLWAVIGDLTGSQLGFGALGIGLLVGLTIAVTAGTSRQLPMIAAILTLLGCLVGDLLIDTRAMAELIGLGTADLARLMSTRPALVRQVITDGFDPLDVAFWVLAIIAAHRLAARGVNRMNILASTRQRAHAVARPSGYDFQNAPVETVAPVIVSHPSEFFALPGAPPPAPDAKIAARLPAQAPRQSAPASRNDPRAF